MTVLTDAHGLHLVQRGQSFGFCHVAAAPQSFQDAVEGQQVGMNFLLTHLVQQLLQQQRRRQDKQECDHRHTP